MTDILSEPNHLKKLIDVANNELEGIDHNPFSNSAFVQLRTRISEFSIQLINESVKTAKRRKSDLVSTSDVEQANQYLVSSSGNKIYRNIGTLGGILLGAGLSTFLSMVVVGVFTTSAVLVALTLTLVGMFMVALQIAKD